ncbi:MAG: hypothetical protein MK105_10400 [Crocinitomicaceae bacterium]|nr:hypothetical protein [Crocinitomicaceae bacterium]
MNSIVSLALILNEWYSNSLRHAFESLKEPRIELYLKREDGTVLLLKYADNACRKRPEREVSFDLELIDS